MAETHRARKRFGQNFLQDNAVIDNIVAHIRPAADQHFIEIGPGQAALTNPFTDELDHSNSLTLLELDRDLARKLEDHFREDRRVQVIQGDALVFDFGAHAKKIGALPLRIFGNLPYNISTPLIFHLLAQNRSAGPADRKPLIRDMHFMLQQEVVDRICAQPDTKLYGRLSVMAQYHCQVEKLFEVPPEAFKPQPKVMSAIVRLRPYTQNNLLANDVTILEALAKAGFSQRRKTIRNTLKAFISEQQLIALDIDPSQRAENLSVAEFVTITNFTSASRQ